MSDRMLCEAHDGSMTNPHFVGLRLPDRCQVLFYAGSEDGHVRELTPEESLKVRNHSPCGWEWGYGGSGPAQLSLAILLSVTGRTDQSTRLYQRFKRAVVCWLPNDNWQMSATAVLHWVNRILATEAATRVQLEEEY